jgi:pyridoxal phosphate enzyme (YggS family)
VTDIERNIAGLNERISRAAARAGRSADEITLVAVTKTFPPELVEEAWNAGLREFGENRVQEAEPKVLWFRERGIPLKWHMVGHLQRNKAKTAIGLFDVVQSVDSLRLARELSRRSTAEGLTLPVLLEVNVSGESSKYGFPLHPDDAGQLEGFLAAVAEIAELPNLDPRGLMTIAPFEAPEDVLRSCFRRLRELLGELRECYSGQHWQHLSMGMTDDFEIAIEEGATIVRIGRAIFGARNDLQEEH